MLVTVLSVSMQVMNLVLLAMPKYAGSVSVLSEVILSEAVSMRSAVTDLSMCFRLHPVLSNRVSVKSAVTVLPISVSFAVTTVSKAVPVWSAVTTQSVSSFRDVFGNMSVKGISSQVYL